MAAPSEGGLSEWTTTDRGRVISGVRVGTTGAVRVVADRNAAVAEADLHEVAVVARHGATEVARRGVAGVARREASLPKHQCFSRFLLH